MSQIAFVSIVGAAGPFPGKYKGAPKSGQILCHQISYETTTAPQKKGPGQSGPSVTFVISLDAIGSKLFHAQKTKERLKTVTFNFYQEVSEPPYYELQCKNATVKELVMSTANDSYRSKHQGAQVEFSESIRVTLMSETVTVKQLSSNKAAADTWKTSG